MQGLVNAGDVDIKVTCREPPSVLAPSQNWSMNGATSQALSHVPSIKNVSQLLNLLTMLPTPNSDITIPIIANSRDMLTPAMKGRLMTAREMAKGCPCRMWSDSPINIRG